MHLVDNQMAKNIHWEHKDTCKKEDWIAALQNRNRGSEDCRCVHLPDEEDIGGGTSTMWYVLCQE